MESDIKVGVVGCGYWGPNLVRNLSGLAHCSVTAVCDQAPDRLAHVVRRYPSAQGYDDYGRMLREAPLDAVVVAVPPRLHFDCARLALEAGKHVFIEKPMTTSLSDAEQLISEARRRGRILMVGHTFLYSEPVRKIKSILDSGDLGELRYISSRRLNLGLCQETLNVVWDLAPHDLSIICHLMGEPPSEVNCCGHAFVTPGIEDASNMSLRFSSGRFAMVHSSWLDPLKVREMTIVGTRRMIVYDDLEPLQKIRIYDTRVEKPPHYDTFSQFHFSYHYGDMYAPRIEQRETLQTECEHFVECVRTGAAPLSGGEAGRDVVRILEAAAESLAHGGSCIKLCGGRDTQSSGESAVTGLATSVSVPATLAWVPDAGPSTGSGRLRQATVQGGGGLPGPRRKDRAAQSVALVH